MVHQGEGEIKKIQNIVHVTFECPQVSMQTFVEFHGVAGDIQSTVGSHSNEAPTVHY